MPSDKGHVQVIPWECQASSKAPGGSRCWGAEEDLGVQTIPAFSSWTSSFPLAGAAGKYVWACLAGGCHMLQEDFAITCLHSVELGCARVLGFISVVAAQPRGCLGDGQER